MDSLKDEDNEEEPSFEMVLEALGATGKFQVINVIFCNIAMFLLAGMVLSFVFEGYAPHHECNRVNETKLLSSYGLDKDVTALVAYESCEIKITTNQSGERETIDSMDCPDGRNFFAAKHTTFLSEWDLVCESRGVAEVSMTSFNVGQLVGAVVGAFLADRYGRKPVLIASSFLGMVLEFSVAAAPSIFFVYGVKFLCGMSYQSISCCYFVYAMEFVTPRLREAHGFLMCVVWIVGALLVGALGYVFRDENWRYFQVGVGMSGIFCLVYPFVLSESPRWLAANGKTEEVLAVLEKASKMNGADFNTVKRSLIKYMNHAYPSSKNSHSLPMIEKNNENFSNDIIIKPSKTSQERKPNMLDLLRIKSLRRPTLIIWYLYLTNVLTYFGLYMTSSSVAGDRFLNYTLMTLVEIPGSFAVYYSMKHINRRVVMEMFLGLTAVSLMTSTLLDSFAGHLEGSSSASTILFILGKFAITCSFNVILIVGPEVFPTNLRATSMGFCAGFARAGAMAAPFFRPLYHVTKWAPGLIFTVMCFLGVVLIFFLPETKDTNLPDTVDDVTSVRKVARTRNETS